MSPYPDSVLIRYYDRKQGLDELAAIRDFAESQALSMSDLVTGSREMHVALDTLNTSIVRAADGAHEDASRQEGLARQDLEVAEENAFVLRQMQEDGMETRMVLKNLRDIAVADLTVTGAIGLYSIRQAEAHARRSEELGEAMVAEQELTNEYLGDIVDILGDVNDGMWAVYDQLEIANAHLVGIREDIQQLDATVRASAQHIARTIVAAARAQTSALVQTLRVCDQRAAERHRELIAVLKSARANQADELYQSALAQFKAHEYRLALRDLRAAVELRSNHALAWILAGRIFRHRGRADLARQAFERARKYAHPHEPDAYVAAILEGARLERLIGDDDAALRILRSAAGRVSQEAQGTLCYEQLKIHWSKPVRTDSPQSMAGKLARQVFTRQPELRDEVAKLLLWEDVRAVRPLWQFGNAPYAALGDHLALVRDRLPGGRYCVFVEERHLGTSDDTTYEDVLLFLEAGRKEHPKAVGKHLTWVQGVAVRTQAECNSIRLDSGDFFEGHDRTVDFLDCRYCEAGRRDKARELVLTNARLWERDANSGDRLPRTFLARLWHRNTLEELVRLLDDVLPGVAEVHPWVLDEIADEDGAYSHCWFQRKWTKVGDKSLVWLARAVERLQGRAQGVAEQKIEGFLSGVWSLLEEKEYSRAALVDREKIFLEGLETRIIEISLLRPTGWFSDEEVRWFQLQAVKMRLLVFWRANPHARWLDDDALEQMWVVERELKVLEPHSADVVRELYTSKIFKEYQDALTRRHRSLMARLEAEAADRWLAEAMRVHQEKEAQEAERGRVRAEEARVRTEQEATRKREEEAAAALALVAKQKRQKQVLLAVIVAGALAGLAYLLT